MGRTTSIKYRFSTVFLLVLAVVIILGSLSIWRLTDYYIFSNEIRDRFFRSTQYIGDLNNFTSDFRAVEATSLIASANVPAEPGRTKQETLDERITLAQHSYEHIYHDPAEAKIYETFKTRWLEYRELASKVHILAGTEQMPGAITLFLTDSRKAFDAASDSLTELTDLNIINAQHAAKRAELAYREARLITTLAVGFAGLFVVGGLLYMRRAIADPLSDLARCMHGLARNAKDIGIPCVDRNDEIGEMARAVVVFRASVIDLAINQRALADQASLLAEKLAAERHLTELQRNFVAMASHEFRTPLTIIDAHAQRMINAKDRLTPDEFAARARKTRNAVLRITSVIDNLIDSARLIDGDAELYFHPSEIDLHALLNEVCRLHREVVPRVVINEAYATTPLKILGDRKLIFQALSNLLSNSIKYSPEGSPIKIKTESHENRISIIIEDMGIGIPKKDLERLFERYFRGSNVSGIVGTGIGLYLVKTVIDLHKGGIAVESKEGQGSRFILSLPLDTDLPTTPA